MDIKSLMRKRVAGVPVPVLALAAGVVGIIVIRKLKSREPIAAGGEGEGEELDASGPDASVGNAFEPVPEPYAPAVGGGYDPGYGVAFPGGDTYYVDSGDGTGTPGAAGGDTISRVINRIRNVDRSIDVDSGGGDVSLGRRLAPVRTPRTAPHRPRPAIMPKPPVKRPGVGPTGRMAVRHGDAIARSTR